MTETNHVIHGAGDYEQSILSLALWVYFQFNDSPSLQIDFQMDFKIKIWCHSRMIYRATILILVHILTQGEEHTALAGFQLL